MINPNHLAFNAGVASAIALAQQTADIIASGDGMAGPRDPVTVEALRTFALEAANLYRAPQGVEAVAEAPNTQHSRANIGEA